MENKQFNIRSNNRKTSWSPTILYLVKKLSFAVSICRVPPFHLDLFNTVIPEDTSSESSTEQEHLQQLWETQKTLS